MESFPAAAGASDPGGAASGAAAISEVAAAALRRVDCIENGRCIDIILGLRPVALRKHVRQIIAEDLGFDNGRGEKAVDLRTRSCQGGSRKFYGGSVRPLRAVLIDSFIVLIGHTIIFDEELLPLHQY